VCYVETFAKRFNPGDSLIFISNIIIISERNINRLLAPARSLLDFAVTTSRLRSSQNYKKKTWEWEMLILLKDCALIIKGSLDSSNGTKFRGTRMILQIGRQQTLGLRRTAWFRTIRKFLDRSRFWQYFIQYLYIESVCGSNHARVKIDTGTLKLSRTYYANVRNIYIWEDIYIKYIHTESGWNPCESLTILFW